MIRIDSKSWDEGFAAGETIGSWPGESRRAKMQEFLQAQCPYPPGSIEALSWHSGYIEGDAKRQGYSYSRGGAD